MFDWKCFILSLTIMYSISYLVICRLSCGYQSQPIFCVVSTVASRFRRNSRRLYIHYQIVWGSCFCLVRLLLCVVSCNRIVPWFKYLDCMHLPVWNTGICKLWKWWQLDRPASVQKAGLLHPRICSVVILWLVLLVI
jgi:hypothetical protein